MEKELDLNTQQFELVAEISLGTFSQLHELRREGDQAQFRKEAQDIFDRQDAQLLEILNHQQWRKYNQMKEKMRKARQSGGRSGRI